MIKRGPQVVIPGLLLLVLTYWTASVLLLGGTSTDTACNGTIATLTGHGTSVFDPLDTGMRGRIGPGTVVCVERTDVLTGATVVRPVMQEGDNEQYLVRSTALNPGGNPVPGAEGLVAEATDPENPYAQMLQRAYRAGKIDPEACIETTQNCTNLNLPTVGQGESVIPSVGANEPEAGDSGGVGGTPRDLGTLAMGSFADIPVDHVASTGRTPGLYGGGAAPMTRAGLAEMHAAARVAEQGAGIELVDAAVRRRHLIHQSAEGDHERLSRSWRNLPPDEAFARLDRAARSLDGTARDLEAAERGLVPAARSRFANLHANAATRARAGASIIGSERQEREMTERVSLFDDLFHAPAEGDGGVLSQVAGLLGAPLQSAATYEAVENRMVMLHGLDSGERARIEPGLALAERRELLLPGGESRDVTLIHAGYVLGGGKSAVDCSSFVSGMINDGQHRFTTQDLRAMYEYLETGSIMDPPTYSKTRGREVREFSESFVPVSLVERKHLLPGDLLVYRLPWDSYGHVFMVKTYDHDLWEAEVIEASGSAGTIRERRFPLSLDPPGTVRHPRPGIMALRLRAGEKLPCAKAPNVAELNQILDRLTLGSAAANRERTKKDTAGKPQASYVLKREIALRNKFASVQETLEYYLDRLLSGAYLGGMGDSERTEFTYWKKSFEHEYYLVAKGHKVVDISASKKSNAVFATVDYEVVDYRDGRGGRITLPPHRMRRTYVFSKDDKGKWKIAFPIPSQEIPVVHTSIAAAR